MSNGSGARCHAPAEVEAALRASQRQLQFVTNHAPVLIAQCGADGCYRYVNRQYAAFFGRTPQALIGLHPQQVLGQTAYEQSAAFMNEALSGGTVKFDQQFVDTASVGHLLQVTFAPEFNEKGTLAGMGLLRFSSRLRTVGRRNKRVDSRRHRRVLE